MAAVHAVVAVAAADQVMAAAAVEPLATAPAVSEIVPVGAASGPSPVWGGPSPLASVGAVPDGSEFAGRLYAAINARDRETIRALSDPDIVVGTTVEAYRGPEALLGWLDEGDDAFDDFTVDLLEVEELGGRVLASMRQRGRGKASGAVVEHGFTHVWTLRDGRATSLHSFANRDDAVRFAEGGGPAPTSE